ncbi:MAG: chorismate synthase [Eubacteriales bacterium]|nr:chorismate synthase [Eubacteriales bacterium]MDD3881628.1 chorismate synthase [Eubacteriales bacterium]MDD4512313.1 chorismate synthase [Eubacteriales bacterium]
MLGNRLRLSVFGESHGEGIGLVAENLPSGIEIDTCAIVAEMARRAPGKSPLSTPRREADEPRFISGVYKGHTTGTPLCAIIENTNTRSADYERTESFARPGHADFTGFKRYSGFNDLRGGGHFSGRLTAPIVLIGAILRPFLSAKGIEIGAHIVRIGKAEDRRLESGEITPELLSRLRAQELPVLTCGIDEKMRAEVGSAKKDGDSVGGIIETAATGLPAGLGDPMFDGVESLVSRAFFAVPAVKGVAFGAGFQAAEMRGSECNDALYTENGRVCSKTNNNGGILGGITVGTPLTVSAAIKPTPSIAIKQKTVTIDGNENGEIEVRGRHDPCIVPRAVPVLESALIFALADIIMSSYE